MRFGVCYYPEHWPEPRWARDAREMRALGIDIVRLAEFAWSRMEPEPGRLEWAWLDRAIETLAAEGHEIVLGTPTATPPAWLTAAHPEILLVDPSGRPRAHGSRRHYCPSSALYRDEAERITRAMAERYGDDPRVVGWQIDNEFGGGRSARCYCERCGAAFRDWLRERYGTLEALNENWGTVFWSQEYGDWDQIPLPDGRVTKVGPSHALDYYRFATAAFVGFQQRQLDLLREASPGRFVTHNFMGLFRELDQFALAAPLDFVTWDNYPTGNPGRWRQRLYPPGMDTTRTDPTFAYDVGDPVVTSMAHALTWGLKRAPFWVMEQQAGHINWGRLNPGIRDGSVRLWVWHAVAEGAETIVYFRWRSTLLAHEQYHSGLVRHDGSPDVGTRDQRRLLAEKALLDRVAAAPRAARVALLFSYEDLWALELQPHRVDFDYLRLHFLYYHALQRLAIPVDLVAAEGDLSGYDLAIAPTLHVVDRDLVDHLEEYVRGGGRLMVGVRSGFKTRSSLVTDLPLPGLLAPLVGARILDWQVLPDGVTWPLAHGIAGLEGGAGYWVERLETEGADALVRFESGEAALTEHSVGSGRVHYLGWVPTPDQTRALLSFLAARAAIEPVAELPEGLLAHRRGDLTVLLNFTDQPRVATVQDREITVGPRGVEVAAPA